uniref:Serpentine receptor class gamma n=1 Tax=Meloidogyne incognita TaxID=6306 RepID=A0A914ML56_MELIC
MISICKRMAKSTCYKIMFVMGVIDMAAVIVVGLLTGYFGYFGFVFCSSPKFIYFVGVHNFFCWATETTMEGILAINRCIELLSSELARKIFSGKKLFFWLGIPILYGLSIIIWERQVMFSGIYFSWFFNPHIGYIDDENVNKEYENTFHSIHNISVISLLVVTYSTFCIIFVLKSKQGGLPSNQQSYSEIMIFLQVFLISLFNIAAASIYIFMQYIHINDVIIIIGQFCWLNAHGIPPVIYLTMNKTIQRDCFKLLKTCVDATIKFYKSLHSNVIQPSADNR